MSTYRALRRILSIRAKESGAESAAPKRSFLGRLARSEAGNTMAMMAIGIFPLAGLVGGGFDMSRLYLVKTRLQQACDAGALAGRRVMGAGQWSANGNAANTAAQRFFDTNFENNAYGTSGRTRTFTEAAGRVTGTASVTVPMTLMRIFGQDQKVITVNCDAEMRLPNTDIMFVLDTTGSMDQTLPGDTATKISTLRFAVKCFYETVARLDTTADCTPGTAGPTGGTGNQTQIRFGFVPYSTNVNVGQLLQNAWMADTWQYQTRTPITSTVYAWTHGSDVLPTSWSGWSARPTSYNTASGFSGFAIVPADTVVGGITYLRRRTTVTTSGNCTNQNTLAGSSNTLVAREEVDGAIGSPTYGAYTPAAPVYGTHTQQTRTGTRTQTQTIRGYRYRWSNPPGADPNGCYLERSNTSTYNRTSTGTGTRSLTWTPHQRLDGWRYQQASLDISGLKAGGSNWNGSITAPLDTGSINLFLSGSSSQASVPIVTNATVEWDGCIEERSTVRATSYSPIPSGAFDLDYDLVPSSGTATSLWGPALPRAVYARGIATNGGGTPSYNPVDYNGNYLNAEGALATCGSPARKLQTWGTASLFENYVDALDTGGNTYHDIGLVWGARLLSPTGLFASENALTPQGGEIERHMIFMTDGETCTSEWNYQAYGLAWYDRRQTPTGTAPTSGCVDNGTLTAQVNARFTALCTAIRNDPSQPTLWVVYFGNTDASTLSRMQNCATSGRFFYANNSAGLISSFRQIAEQISQLRLTR